MAKLTPKIRPPGKIHGGKSYLARRIVAEFPPHDVYVEPFFGMGSVLLNKPKVHVEHACDVNEELIQFWLMLQRAPRSLVEMMEVTPYCQASFDEAQVYLDHPYPYDANRVSFSWYVRQRMSRGGLGTYFADSERERGGQPEGINSWETMQSMIPRIAERVQGVHFGCMSWEHMTVWDGLQTLYYLDPPYLPSTRTAKHSYGPHEMSMGDHLRLLATALRLQGMVALSGYSNPIYDHALAGWRRLEWEMPNHAGQGKKKGRRTECLWVNW